MKSKRGIIGSFISMFVATVVIVLILLVFILASGFVKKYVQEKDNFGIQNETKVGIDDVFDYMEFQFSNMTHLRIVVRTNGDWEGWLREEMRYEK
jgi:hypothetical protein